MAFSVDACVAFSDYQRQWEWGKSESKGNQKYKEKEREKVNKIINESTIVTVHICTVTVAIVQKCTILHPLMWVFFEPKCVKWLPFSILQNYSPTDVIALSICIVLRVRKPMDSFERKFKVFFVT